MQELVDTSVIIPTYNGENKILNVLKSLEKQEYKDFETIVVVDGSTDDTLLVLEQNKIALRNFKVIEQSNKGRAGARNAGAKEATGDLLIFFDDDMRPIEKCIVAHVEHHKKVPKSILAGALMEDYYCMKTDIQRYKAKLGERWMKQLPTQKDLLTIENMFLSAANFSIPKTLFEELNGFDERLSDSEDLMFSLKAFNKNTNIYFDINAFAWHDDFISCTSYINRQKEYMLAKENAKHISIEYKKFLDKYSPIKKRSIGKKIARYILCRKSLIKLIDQDKKILKLIPSGLRYRLYDIIIWESARE